MTDGRTKQEWRTELIGRRRGRPEPERDSAREANAAHLLAHVSSIPAGRRGGPVVAGFLPLSSEPLGAALLDALTAAGARVLVPVAAEGEPLNWCDFPCRTRPGPFGIPIPAGPRHGVHALLRADLVLVPALAVDRRGARLGRGGGHYDRSLALLPAARAAPGGPGGAGPDRSDGPHRQLIAVLFDDELVDELPAEPHDLPVDATVTPGRGVRTVVR